MSNKALKILSNVRTLRVLAREVDIEKLESLAEKLNAVISERKQEIALLQTEEKERLERIEKYKEILKKEESLLGIKRKSKRRKSAPRPAKYKFTDAQGNEKTWTGQGRTPKELVGKDLNEYLIES
jgi:DNA-binding protein H-NS